MKTTLCRAAGVLVLTLTSLSGSAIAKDVCLKDSFGNDYVIKQPKKLKAAGAIALTGVFIASGDTNVAPFDGAAALNAAGTTAHFGVFVHTLSSSNNFTAEWTGDATFAGSGFIEVTGTNPSTRPISFTTEDCFSVTIP